ncbi:MAG TPA: glucosamine-6-phosphate deaminase [Halomicronema sp.]
MSNFTSPASFSNNIKNFQVDALRVQVYHSLAEMAKEAAQVAGEYLLEIIKQKNSANIILATGQSQIEFLKYLVAISELDWSKITLFHLDEYLGIDGNHPASFRYYLREKVEKLVKPKKFYYLEGDTNEPLQECERYSQLLEKYPSDLVCLGIGKNGHIAFNEPAVADFEDPKTVKLIKLDNTTREQLVESGNFAEVELVPQYAFTLTIPIICASKKILCFAPEKHKAVIVKKILESSIDPQIPATILRKQSHATLFLDTSSASSLNI